ncbi:peptidoglycan DD-metalloendopeptidase family protein [Planococcus wigleyi]|uniref:Peptidoglycan DD-metalloendopeptidase family protein n=1 Tax=Planococcus wigleyi TaxID=2762216 RepID=A0ABR8WA58_9BACL|nr:peptidoglycan DD-metalloendopeptidase family protein [Planococcus wigleyi]MBD8013894.1 peptidoglycan DD-metalloendopeptidase family protein [Planococcus wigleyi]
MATVGRSNIEITADTSRARRSLGDFFREAENGGRNLARMFNTLDPFSRIERDARNASGGFNNVRDAAGRLNSDLNNLGGRNNLDELNGDLSDAERNMDDLHRSTDDVGDGLDDASRDMRDFGNTAERETSNAEGSFGKMADTAKKIGGVLVAAFAVDKVVEFGTELAATAGAAEASRAQFSTVFGDMEGEAAKRLSAIGGEATILENRMKDSFTKIAAFAKTGGMDTADSLDLADRSMRAVADSAAFYDRSLEDTTESLQSFLKGNYENDAALGLSATETTRNSAAMDLYGKKFKDLSEAQKQLTLLQMVEDANKLTGALGQASRESDGWENVVGNMTQAWTDFKGEIGAPVLKVAVAGIKGVTTAVQALNTEAIGNGIGKAFDYVSGSIKKAKDALAPFIDGVKGIAGAIKGLMTDDGQAGRDILKGMGFSEETIMMLDGYAAKIAEFRHKLSDFLAGIGGLFKDDGQAGRDFLASLGLSDDAIAKIDAFAANFSAVRGRLKETIGGFKELLQGDGAKGRSILDGLGFTDGFIQTADDIALKLVSVKNTALDVFGAIAKVVESRGQVIREVITAALILIWPPVKSALSTVLGFLGETIGKIVDFFKSDGAQIVQAVMNLGKIIGVIFLGIFNVIQFIMPAVLAIIRSIWKNIEGVISGALDIIMGAVKIFSGLFTGDFSKMWEGLKRMFLGAVTFLWNFVQLTFFGKILGGAKLFILSFRGFFVSLWQGIISLFKGNTTAALTTISTAWQSILRLTREVFSNLSGFLVNTWNSIRSITTGFINGIKVIFTSGWSIIRNTTTTIFRGIWNFLNGLFVIIRTGIQAYINFYVRFITTGWRAIATTTTNIFRGIWTFLSGIFTTIRNFISSSVSGILSKVRDTWSALRNSTSNTFRDIYNGIKSRFTNIVDLAKSLPGRIGDGIGSMASKVTSGVTKVINKLATTLGKGVNGVIGGINWVLGKIGVDKDIPKWEVPQYAKGTKGNGKHPGGPMVVGDGTGTNAGPELIRMPDGRQMLSPSKPTLMHGDKGTEVWSATETRKILEAIPHYALGDKVRKAKDWLGENVLEPAKSVGSKVVSGAKKVGGTAKDWAVDIFDYVKKPGKLLDLALSAMGIKEPEGGSFIGNIARGGWGKVKEAGIDFLKGKLNDFGASQSGISLTGGNGGGFGPPFRFTSGPGPRNTGIPGASSNHKGWDWAAPIGTPIPSVTDGVGHRTGWHPLSGNFVEVRDSSGKIHRYQHNSRNIMKVGQPVRKGQTVGLVGNTGVGSGAHVHYEVKRGYAKGGIIKAKQLAWLAEEGMEAVIPLVTNRDRGIDLWRKVGQHFGFDMDAIFNQGQNQIDYTGSAVSSIVNKVPGTNGSPVAAGSGLTLNVEVKPSPVYLDGQHLTDIIFDHVDSRFVRQSEIDDIFKGRE